MNTYPWLTTIALLPLVGSLIVVLLPKHNAKLAKSVALAFSLVTLGAVIAMSLNFEANSEEVFQFAESYTWIPSFGINFSFGVDGIALVLIALATTLVPVVIFGGWNEAIDSQGSVKGYFALILVLESLMIGVFAAYPEVTVPRILFRFCNQSSTVAISHLVA